MLTHRPGPTARHPGPLARLQPLLRTLRRRPAPTAAQLGYAAALQACEAACAQIATATDPWVRQLALLQLAAGHEAAALLATEPPPLTLPPAAGPDPDAGALHARHQLVAEMCEWLAATERCLCLPGAVLTTRFSARPDPAWVGILGELTETRDPRRRARLVLHLGLLAEQHPGPPDVGELAAIRAVAGAYLALGGGYRRELAQIQHALTCGPERVRLHPADQARRHPAAAVRAAILGGGR